MVTGFNHSGFVVQDLEAMVAFYRDALGLSVIREADSIAPPSGDHTGFPGARRKLVFVGKPGGEHMLELVHYIDPPSPEGPPPASPAGRGPHMLQRQGPGVPARPPDRAGHPLRHPAHLQGHPWWRPDRHLLHTGPRGQLGRANRAHLARDCQTQGCVQALSPSGSGLACPCHTNMSRSTSASALARSSADRATVV